MQDQPKTQIVIRHVGGANINKIEQFALDAVKEISFGRDTRSTIVFDSPHDDVVSRKHAVLRVKSEDPLAFAIEDLNSSNGTYVNGKRITGEVEIAPDDRVQFGSAGPELIFDVQPRPASLASKTRVMSAIETSSTRVVAAASTSLADAKTVQTTQKLPPKAGIGKNTVMMLLSDERRKTSQVWMGAMGAVIAFVLVGGGVLYWHNTSTAQKLQQDAEDQRQKIAYQQEQIRADTSSTISQGISGVTQQMGLSSGEVIGKYGNSTVLIEMSWRLYDKETGRPIYHKRVEFEDNRQKKSLPGYLKLDSGKIVPWLTTEDENNSNYEIRQGGSGSGFVVSEQGFILTNKHVASGWMVRTSPTQYLPGGTSQGALVTTNPKGKRIVKVIDIGQERDAEHLFSWVPGEDGGYLFSPHTTGVIKRTNSDLKNFNGRNENLEVRFPGSRVSINATLIRTSTDSDAALIKVDSPQLLTPMEMSIDDVVKPGDKVIVLGYPGISDKTVGVFTTHEGGLRRQRVEHIPEPTVTEGIISRVGTAETQLESGMKVLGQMGDAIQLSVSGTGSGNSGGPVFNNTGKVIGLWTWGRSMGGVRVGFAVPIKHGRSLLQPQRIQ